MGMSFGVYGVRKDMKEFNAMLKAKEALDDADMEYPEALRKYFDDCASPDSTEADLKKYALQISVPYGEEGSSGNNYYVVKLTDLPKNCEEVVFHMSY